MGRCLRLHRIAAFTCAMILIVLSWGCSQQQLTTDTCIVHSASTFAGAGGGNGSITVARNGRPCGMAFVQNNLHGTGFVADPQLLLRPSHGSAAVRMSNGMALITYTPDRDFVGPDLYKIAFGPNFTLTVDVNVVPLP